MVTRWSEKSPGLKILWIWTLGTAGVLIASVVRTRLHDMEKILKEEDAAAIQSEPTGVVTAPNNELLKD